MYEIRTRRRLMSSILASRAVTTAMLTSTFTFSFSSAVAVAIAVAIL